MYSVGLLDRYLKEVEQFNKNAALRAHQTDIDHRRQVLGSEYDSNLEEKLDQNSSSEDEYSEWSDSSSSSSESVCVDSDLRSKALTTDISLQEEGMSQVRSNIVLQTVLLRDNTLRKSGRKRQV